MNIISQQNKSIGSTYVALKNKSIERLLPKAYVIKIKDIIPLQFYKQLLEQKIVINSDHIEISTWYTSNREHCVEYLQKLSNSFQLKDNTFFNALSYADMLMRNSEKMTKKEYDLKIISSLLLASKYVENEAYDLDLNEFISLENDFLYNKNDIKKYEVKCLKELEYELSEPTVYDFLISQLACGVIYKDELNDKNAVNIFVNFATNTLLQTAKSHLSLLYKPETIALSVIHYCRLHFHFKSSRINHIKSKLQFNDIEFETCSDYLNSFKKHIHRKKSIKIPLNSQLKKCIRQPSLQKNKKLTLTLNAKLNLESKWVNSSCSTLPNLTSSLVQVSVLTQQNQHTRSNNKYDAIILKSNPIRMSTTYQTKSILPNIYNC